MQIRNPNFKIDPILKDERGFNSDIGIRGTIKNILYFDASLYYLYYNNRIGTTLETDTNLFNPTSIELIYLNRELLVLNRYLKLIGPIYTRKTCYIKFPHFLILPIIMLNTYLLMNLHFWEKSRDGSSNYI